MSKSAKKRRARNRRKNRPTDLKSRIEQLHGAGPVFEQSQGIPATQWSEQYQRIRGAGRRLNEALVESIDKEGMRFAAKSLGMLRGDVFVFDDEDEVSLMMDYAIYNYRPDGMNAIERMAKESPPDDDSDEATWMAGALQSYHSMFLVVDRLPGFGIQARDVFSGEAVLVADVSFSESATLGLTVAARLLPMENFSMTSGTALPVTHQRVLLEIGKYVGRTCPKLKHVRSLSPDRALYLESYVIRTCLAAGGMQRIRYE